MNTPKKRILVSVTGLTPQVVTETLYAFVQNNRVPDEIRIITTKNGRNLVIDRLLDEKNGIFHELCRDFGLTGRIRFDESCVTVITDRNGNELEDIRTPQDNDSAADIIVGTIRDLCSDENNEVHVSLAGGRKTMGFYIGYALSLFGRNCDTLSHVLVSQGFEANRDFFYPTQQKKEIVDPLNGRILNARDAQIMLAEIPFVRMREGSTAIIEGNRSFSEYVHSAQKVVDGAARIFIEPFDQTVKFGGSGDPVRFSPALIATYIFFARRRMAGLPPLSLLIDDESDEYESIRTEFLKSYAIVVNRKGGAESPKFAIFRDSIQNADDLKKKLTENISRFNKDLRKHLNESAAALYGIQPHGKRGTATYGILGVPANAIGFPGRYAPALALDTKE